MDVQSYLFVTKNGPIYIPSKLSEHCYPFVSLFNQNSFKQRFLMEMLAQTLLQQHKWHQYLT